MHHDDGANLNALIVAGCGAHRGNMHALVRATVHTHTHTLANSAHTLVCTHTYILIYIYIYIYICLCVCVWCFYLQMKDYCRRDAPWSTIPNEVVCIIMEHMNVPRDVL